MIKKVYKICDKMINELNEKMRKKLKDSESSARNLKLAHY
jgi:CHASE3 domain sensor protein